MKLGKTYLPRHAGPCAKAEVVAVLVTPEGKRYQSSNFCLSPQKTCPRDEQGYKSGEGYHLCKEICLQPAHAEENVIYFARKHEKRIEDSTIYVDYVWICNNCKKVSAEAGIEVVIGKPPILLSEVINEACSVFHSNTIENFKQVVDNLYSKEETCK